MTIKSNTSPREPDQIEVVTTRDLAASRERVFEMFSNPKHLGKWWGPEGFTNTFHEFDFRPGGNWRFTMHGPDGTDYPMHNRFEVILPTERIVVRHFQENHGFELSMAFSENADDTTLTWCMLFDPGVGDAELKEFITGANEQNMDRLEVFLTALQGRELQSIRRSLRKLDTQPGLDQSN